jgi:hypothetical protein
MAGLTAMTLGAEYAHHMSTLVPQKKRRRRASRRAVYLRKSKRDGAGSRFADAGRTNAWLVSTHETARRVVHGQWKIYRGQKLVGYLVVLSNE